MKQKRLSVLIVGMSDKIGGVENVVKNLYDNIKKDNIQFDFLTFANKCAYEEYFLSNKGKVYHFIGRRKNFFKSSLQLKRFFRDKGQVYDYIWIHLSSASNILVYKYAKKYTKAKIISHSHSTNIESKNYIFYIIYQFLHKKNKKLLNQLTDYYIACSEAAGIWLYGKENKMKINVIPNGIDVNRYKFNPIKRNELRNELKLQNKFIIGHIGRFTHVKNHTYLIDVFKEIKLLKPNSILLLVGEGECMSGIKEKVSRLGLSEDVVFLGFRKDIPDLLAAMDCMLLPSIFEGSPVVIVEAIVSGLMCVVSSNINENFNNSPLVQFMPIDIEPSLWAKMVVNMQEVKNRESCFEHIQDSKFDIKLSANKITSIFSEHLENQINYKEL